MCCYSSNMKQLIYTFMYILYVCVHTYTYKNKLHVFCCCFFFKYIQNKYIYIKQSEIGLIKSCCLVVRWWVSGSSFSPTSAVEALSLRSLHLLVWSGISLLRGRAGGGGDEPERSQGGCVVFVSRLFVCFFIPPSPPHHCCTFLCLAWPFSWGDCSSTPPPPPPQTLNPPTGGSLIYRRGNCDKFLLSPLCCYFITQTSSVAWR